MHSFFFLFTGVVIGSFVLPFHCLLVSRFFHVSFRLQKCLREVHTLTFLSTYAVLREAMDCLPFTLISFNSFNYTLFLCPRAVTLCVKKKKKLNILSFCSDLTLHNVFQLGHCLIYLIL